MNTTRSFGAAGSLALCAAVFAQPASFTDLGNHTSNETFTQAVTLLAGNDIQWFRIGLPANSPADGYTDIWTSTSGLGDNITDTEIGLYDAAGNLIRSDDDGDDGLYSLLSFGLTSPPRPAHGAGAAFAGQSGTLGGGTYWLAVGRFNVTFLGTNWGVSSTYTGADRTTSLNFAIVPAGAPIPPSATMVLTPNTGIVGDVFTAAVTVTPGANPPSTGITVHLDATSVNGGSNIAAHDDGVAPDNVAGDNIFSANITVGAGTFGGVHAIMAHVQDQQSRSGDASANFTSTEPAQWDETRDGGGDAGELPATAAIPAGSGNLRSISGVLGSSDSDMYKIQICDAAGFSASTVSTDTTGDTQLWLFSEDGHGVQFNDDAVGLQSRMEAQFVATTGVYYIAVSQYNRDAVDDASQLIWLNNPFTGVRAPDGAGAANIISAWDAGSTPGLNYFLTLTGSCFASDSCAADFNGDEVVDFFDYLDFVQAFAANDPSADFNADQVIDFFDYLDFVQAFAAGC